MNPNDITIVLRGIGWIFFFLAPLFTACGFGIMISEESPAVGLFFVTLILQLALILSIGHSWNH